MNTPTIGWSDFARNQHRMHSGNSYSLVYDYDVVNWVKENWHKREPGNGEKDTSRKVVVGLPVEANDFFRTPFIDLRPDLPVRARVTQRQAGEDYYIETFVDPIECRELGIELTYRKVNHVAIICYSAEALLENDGTRSTDCEWEIVAILASDSDDIEPMRPLTMARNQLEAPGGTKSEYTPEEFARSIMYWSAKKGIKVLIP